MRYTFRTCGRDDLQGAMVGDHLAKEWAGAEIAIVHDGQAYGQRNRRGSQTPAGRARHRGRVVRAGAAWPDGILRPRRDASRLAASTSFSMGAIAAEAGLIVRQAKARLPGLAFVVPDGVGGRGLRADRRRRRRGHPDDLLHGRGAAACGRRRGGGVPGCRHRPDRRRSSTPTRPSRRGRRRSSRRARRTRPPVAEALRQEQFDTVLGTIGFDAKGDVTGFEPVRLVRLDGRQVGAEGPDRIGGERRTWIGYARFSILIRARSIRRG